jgi:NAD(P)-dependent dehydrogenase (short-subunit alcohol dehydrogenase family)
MTAWHDLTGHVALVTGGNSGIGLGMARGLRRAGASVAIWGTNADNNATAVAALKAESANAPVASYRVDVSDEDAVAAGVAQTLETFGQIDSCFANAGVAGHPAPIDTMSTDEWRRVLAVNLDGQFYTVRAVAGHMKSRRTGSIVFTSSVSMSDGLAYATHYAAAKAALTAMARGLAVELAREKIRVNAIVPGWTRAAMTETVSITPPNSIFLITSSLMSSEGGSAVLGAMNHPDNLRQLQDTVQSLERRYRNPVSRPEGKSCR